MISMNRRQNRSAGANECLGICNRRVFCPSEPLPRAPGESANCDEKTQEVRAGGKIRHL